MKSSVDQCDFCIRDRITCEYPAFCRAENTLFYRRDELARDSATFDLIFKSNTCTRDLLRFHLDYHVAVLAAAT